MDKKTVAFITVIGVLVIGSVYSLGVQKSESNKNEVQVNIDNSQSKILSNGTTKESISSNTDDDNNLENVLKQIEELNGLTKELNELTKKDIFFNVEEISKGSKLIGKEGCEVILRGGKARVITSGADGLVNATDGSEIKDGDEIKHNNVIIFPRDDGRGIIAETDIYILIKGEYSLEW